MERDHSRQAFVKQPFSGEASATVNGSYTSPNAASHGLLQYIDTADNGTITRRADVFTARKHVARLSTFRSSLSSKECAVRACQHYDSLGL
jgi:hypothetical protein